MAAALRSDRSRNEDARAAVQIVGGRHISRPSAFRYHERPRGRTTERACRDSLDDEHAMHTTRNDRFEASVRGWRRPYRHRHGVLVAAALLALLTSLPATALAPQPHELVSDVIARVMARLGETPAAADDAVAGAAVLSLFEQELSPYLAFGTITRWVAGKSWATLGEAQQAELLEAIRGHIVHVYATLLARGRSVDIRIDDSSVVKAKSAQVGATLATPDGRDFSLEFRLLRAGDDWKLFDLTVDGLSFARSLRAELSPVISDGGVKGLRQYLDKHRQATAAAD